MDIFIHEEYVNRRHEMKKKQRQQQLWIQTNLQSDVPMAVAVESPATSQDAAASPSTAGSPAMAGAGGRRGAASFDRLLGYFKPN